MPAVIKAAMAAKTFAKTLSRIFQNKKWKQRCSFISWKFIFDTNLSIRTSKNKDRPVTSGLVRVDCVRFFMST